MNKTSLQSSASHESGFVLLFSLVVSAIIFLVGAGIFSLSFKELITSTISQESQKSIFAADSGVECALAADTNNNAFEGEQIPFQCFGNDINPSLAAGVYTFNIAFIDNKTCSIVQVDTTGDESVTVIAQGYNKCSGDRGDQPVLSYPGLAERVYRVTFLK
ncbi:MAG TPA: hypothetical protein PKZ56_01305 [Candidatus Paceibacterota bacterium]|nr:hypothetical protein [Candidatus Paceibacterota bacterium]